MKFEISVGEAIDKLSILELKLKKISDENKKIEIQKEINVLQECHKYKDYYLYYNLLMYVNEKIWDMTDVIKSITPEDSSFAIISNQIFEFNQKRFRIKNWFNLTANSDIKEQKSYSLSQCKIYINNIDVVYKKISEILFLSLEYDVVTIISRFNDKIKNIFKIPTIMYSEYDDMNNITHTIFLENFEIPDKHIQHIFEFKPILYISGGLMGDFVHQLSVINEKFLHTGRKGILYIASVGDNFRLGLSRAYDDTYKLISEQIYIKKYNIYNNEKYDINLSEWRNSSLLYKTSWDNIFLNTYNINWGINKWINVPVDNKWCDTILISTTSYRNPYNIDFVQICANYGKSIKFISLNIDEYNLFKNNFNIHNIESYNPTSIYDLCVAINSCKLFIGNFSSPLAFAYGMHKKSIVGLHIGDQSHHIGLEKIIPNLTISIDKNVVMEEIVRVCN